MQRFAIIALSVVLLTTIPAAAEMTDFRAQLDGAQETRKTNTESTGQVDMTYDSETHMITWLGTYEGLSGPATATHFHGPAKPGNGARAILPVEAIESPFSGAGKLTSAQAAELMANEMYFNVHTTANPDGEIRGQVIKVK